MTLAVCAIDLGDDVALDHAHRVMRRAALEDGRTWTTMWSRERMATALRQPPAGEMLSLLGAYDGPAAPESLVGVAFVHRDLAANTDLLHLDCWVEPELRRRGIGSALVEAVVGLARSAGCTRLTAEASYAFADADAAPALLFARAHGFTVGTVEVFRELALPVPEGVLDRADAAVLDRADGYAVRTFDGVPDDAVLPSYVGLLNQLALDAPSGQIEYEAQAMTPAAVRTALQQRLDGGQRVLISIATRRDAPDEAVAHSDLIAPAAVDYVHQESTLVRRDHRGHGLGTLVKTANLRALQRLLPDRTRVLTQNAEVNDVMIAINEQLGFRPVALCPGFLRRLG